MPAHTCWAVALVVVGQVTEHAVPGGAVPRLPWCDGLDGVAQAATGSA